jgi:hypothetical protein
MGPGQRFQPLHAPLDVDLLQVVAFFLFFIISFFFFFFIIRRA